MTQAERRSWIESGQIVVICTLAVLLVGAVRTFANQAAGLSDQVLQQATASATAAADIKALAERIGKVESQINYVLMAAAGSLIAQLFQLRANKR